MQDFQEFNTRVDGTLFLILSLTLIGEIVNMQKYRVIIEIWQLLDTKMQCIVQKNSIWLKIENYLKHIFQRSGLFEINWTNCVYYNVAKKYMPGDDKNCCEFYLSPTPLQVPHF